MNIDEMGFGTRVAWNLLQGGHRILVKDADRYSHKHDVFVGLRYARGTDNEASCKANYT